MADDLIPDLETLTHAQAHQIVCADYLRAIASLVEKGALSAFELDWSIKSGVKPVGRLVVGADFLMSAAEIELNEKIEAAKQKIQVEDRTKDLAS